MSVVVIAVVLTALVFDFTNGFHDTANAMATSIATGALRPAGGGAAGRGTEPGRARSCRSQVALTISSGLVDEARITPQVIFGGAGRRDPVEPADLAAGAAVELLARPVRRPDRGDLGVRRSGAINFSNVVRQGAGAAGALAGRRRPDRADRHLPSPTGITARGRRAHRRPAASERRRSFRLDGRPGARHQRRPEDHGRDHPDADQRRACCRRTPHRRCG